MKLSALIFMAAAAFSSSAVPEQWFSAYLTADTDGFFEDATLVSKPDRAEVAAALPSKAVVSYRIMAICRVRQDGTLHNCRAQELWPNEQSTFLSVRKLLPRFRLSRTDAALAKVHDAEVLLSLYLDDDSRKLDRSCPPGWCPVTPAPPPG